MKRALVVSGGAAKGAFAVGVAQRLRDRCGVTFDTVAGTSTGALIAPLAILNRLTDLERLYMSFASDDLFTRLDAVDAFRAGHLLDTTPLRTLADHTYDDALFDAVMDAGEAGRQIFLAAVNMTTGRVAYFHTGPPPRTDPDRELVRITTRAELVDGILASAFQPVIMPLVERDGMQYADGGVRETAPIRVVVDAGATDVFAIVLTAPDEEVRTPDAPPLRGIPATAGRTLSLMLAEIVRDDIETPRLFSRAFNYVNVLRHRLRSAFPDGARSSTIDRIFDELEPDNPFAGTRVVSFHLIRPEERLLADSLRFTRADMRRMLRLGADRVDALFPDGHVPSAPHPIV
jgi:NTE family protein